MKQLTAVAAVGAIALGLVDAAFHLQPARAASECQGNACGVVSVTFDASVGKQRVKNSGDRAVKVELDHPFGAGTNTLRVGPGEAKYAFFTSFKLPYRANYD